MTDAPGAAPREHGPDPSGEEARATPGPEASAFRVIVGRYLPGFSSARRNGVTTPIATKLTISYLLIIGISIVAFGVVGTQIVGRLIMSEAEATVRNNLNAARELLLARLRHVNDVVRLTADRFFLKEALAAGNAERLAIELARVREKEGLDILALTDGAGRVRVRTGNPDRVGDDVSRDEIVAAVLATREPASAVSVMPAEDLRREAPRLAEQAYFRLIETPMARSRQDTEETAGMVLKAAAPILDARGAPIGVLYGGILLNRNYEIVDRIKQTVFQDVVYRDKDIGTATIFLGDVRISTNVRNRDGTRAVATRIAEDVYNRVIVEGNPWIGRAYVVNNWYVTAYEPIQNVNHRIIGILYVGVLEQKYLDMKARAVLSLLALTLVGALISMGVSHFISRRVSVAVRSLVSASKEVSRGNLGARVEIDTNDELQDLADSFNAMASALRRRDEQLKDYATRKIKESERLAITGQLAAGVAHELNNPLQGVVTYSHLLLERAPADDPARPTLQKMVGQANRCRDIVRGLLDFARPKRPSRRPSSVNAILRECIALVENQAQFHNIRVVKHLSEDLPPAVLDPSQAQQVFMNAIINAAEAMDGVGQLTVATRLDPEGEYVEIAITDTGHGIRPEDMDRIFDPFFTTKEGGHGAGLGLAISYGIVKEHGGTIAVQSEAGAGATFVIRFPLTAREAA